MEIPARIQSKITITAKGCWEWGGALSDGGYGVIRITTAYRTSHNEFLHRWVYEQLIGPIPAGLDIDHLPHCRNRKCCNPDHLEPVTRKENLARGAGPGGALWQQATVCRNGHDLTLPHARTAPTRDKPRGMCRICRNAVVRRSSQKRSHENARHAD